MSAVTATHNQPNRFPVIYDKSKFNPMFLYRLLSALTIVRTCATCVGVCVAGCLRGSMGWYVLLSRVTVRVSAMRVLVSVVCGVCGCGDAVRCGWFLAYCP